jgi:hypothetical protein
MELMKMMQGLQKLYALPIALSFNFFHLQKVHKGNNGIKATDLNTYAKYNTLTNGSSKSYNNNE